MKIRPVPGCTSKVNAFRNPSPQMARYLPVVWPANVGLSAGMAPFGFKRRILPWVEVKNLASAVLARGLARLAADWPQRYGVEPWLVETLVDPRLYHGGSYRAANWIAVGETTGRGRMDRHHRGDNEARKTVLIYPLVRDASRRLRES